MKNPQTSLPPGFRFHPTDEELILHYLRKRVISIPLPVSIIAEVDIYKFDPWDLPAKATFGEKEWYFFSPRDRKYPNGARPNRAAASGYWKATGTDKTIMTMVTPGGGQQNIGVKKALVFYKGRPPKGVKTNWIMHEYRLAESPTHTYSNVNKSNNKFKDSSMRLDDWVLCRIYKKTNVVHPIAAFPSDQEEEEQFIQDAPLPSLIGDQQDYSFKSQKSSSFSDLLDAMDYSILSNLLADCPSNSTTGFDQSISSIPGFNTGSPDQPFYNSCVGNNSGNYTLQKLPQLQFSAPTTAENRLKRQLPPTGAGDDQQAPPKKCMNSFSFLSSNIQSEIPQNNLMNQLFLNQQLFFSPELQFQGY